MAFEKSAGAVVFRKTESGETLFLLLRNTKGHADFPKGNLESGESEEQAAKRETEEESGIKDLVFIPGFREVVKYFYRRGGMSINKEVVYFLAETKTDQVKISWEHAGFEWLSYKDALVKIDYNSTKSVLKKAQEFLTGSKGLGKFLNK